jgi:dienelactone hydrolase
MMRWAIAALLLVSPTAFAAMQSREVTWTHEGTEFQGYVVYDDQGPARPGLLMVPNWMGVTDSAVEKARQVAASGYVVLVADVYGKDVRPANTDEAGRAASDMYADRKRLRARAGKALDVLRQQAGSAPLDASRLGAFGFCFGGAVALEMARAGAPLAGVVSLHGALDTSIPAQAGTPRAAVLVLNGADDTYVTREHIVDFEDEMNRANVDWQFVNFSDAVHCFAEADANSPPGCVYHERSAKRAYRMMHDFFAEVFGNN